MDISKIMWHINLVLKRHRFNHVGKQSYLGSVVSIIGAKDIWIGDRVRIYPGSRLETHDGGKIIIEDNCSIAQNFHITSAKSELRIGKNTTISGNVFITNIDHEYKNVGEHILDQPMIVKETVIGQNCFIGYGAAIQAGTILGKQCIVGTNAVVRGIFPDYSVLVGVPARIVKRYNMDTKVWERVKKDD